MYISIGPSPMIDIFSMDYPPIFIIVFRQPSEIFYIHKSTLRNSSLEKLPHVLTPISLGCPSAYEMHCDAISITHITHAYIHII